MNEILRIPYTSLGKNGVLEITYKPNTGPYDSGLYLIKDLKGDMELSRGYPTMKAEIIEYEGTGYGTACAWIQIVHDKFYDDTGRLALEDDEVDAISQRCRETGFPFYCLGFLPTIYDAPCLNLMEYQKLDWTAHTWLVSTPTRMNDHQVQYLAGFEWGYIEQLVHGQVDVEIKPLRVLSGDDWKRSVEILKKDFGGWDYE